MNLLMVPDPLWKFSIHSWGGFLGLNTCGSSLRGSGREVNGTPSTKRWAYHTRSPSRRGLGETSGRVACKRSTMRHRYATRQCKTWPRPILRVPQITCGNIHPIYCKRWMRLDFEIQTVNRTPPNFPSLPRSTASCPSTWSLGYVHYYGRIST